MKLGERKNFQQSSQIGIAFIVTAYFCKRTSNDTNG